MKIFNNLTSGKFWLSGTASFDPDRDRYVQNKNVQFGVWDLTRLAGRSYIYAHDNDMEHYNNTSTYKPCLKQCMLSYLDSQEQQFLEQGFARAVSSLKEYCEDRFFHAFVLLAPPGASVGLHRHRPPLEYTPTGFTYIISSNESVPATSLITTVNGNVTHVPYPDCQEFFVMHNIRSNHGTITLPQDKNHYLYFVFDGVAVNRPNTKLAEFYTP